MKRIQIALVSKETLPVFYLINEFLPEVVYLVGTSQTGEEMANIEKVAQGINVSCEKRITKSDDMKDSYRVCKEIVIENGEDNEYCYNLTCGTKLMAFGALVCAQEYKSKVLYTDTTFYTDLDQFERKPLTRMLDIDTIIALQGQKVKDKQLYKPDEARTMCAKDIQDFVQYHVGTYSTLAEHYRKYKQIPNPYNEKDISYSYKNGRLVIEQNGVEIFSSDYKGVYKMLFEGRWWETLVADAVYQWTGGKQEVWTSVRFEPKNDSKKNIDKNEIDVLVNIGNVLLFVECKSGAFTQDNIYKLSSVYKTYGSYKSKGVIVSYRDNVIKPELEEKAKEEHVKILVPVNKKTGKVNLATELDKVVKMIKS